MTTKLSGKVTAHGHPATGAVVELHNSAGDTVDQVQVDESGHYTYHLAPGTWNLNVWDAHGHRGSGQVTIGDGDEATLDVELSEPHGGH